MYAELNGFVEIAQKSILTELLAKSEQYGDNVSTKLSVWVSGVTLILRITVHLSDARRVDWNLSLGRTVC